MQPISRGRLILALILAAAFTAAASALAQLSQDPTWRPRVRVGGNGRYRTPPISPAEAEHHTCPLPPKSSKPKDT